MTYLQVSALSDALECQWQRLASLHDPFDQSISHGKSKPRRRTRERGRGDRGLRAQPTGGRTMRPDELLTLEQRISAERFAPYRAATSGDLERALRRYERNTEISAAFWAVLSDLEIVVRNAMHERLSVWSAAAYGRPDWYVDRGRIFTAQTASDLRAARRHAPACGRLERAGPLVPELPLGFWRFLLSRRYERSLWLPCLRDAFPGIRGKGMRRDVHDAMRDLHLLRNRIAHHEPIHNRPLGELHAVALATAGRICPTTRGWIAARSQVPALLADPRFDPPVRAPGGKNPFG